MSGAAEVEIGTLSFAAKTQLVKDLRSTYTIWSRDHGLEEAITIATFDKERAENVTIAIGAAVDRLGANAGVRACIMDAIRAVEAS